MPKQIVLHPPTPSHRHAYPHTHTFPPTVSPMKQEDSGHCETITNKQLERQINRDSYSIVAV